MDGSTTAADLFVCPNCGTETPGPFCFHCGQKRPVDADLSLRHAVEHVGEELLHVDGKILTTVKLLFTRPWQLALDFLEGRRARHVHPMRLFLTFGAVFFLLQASTMTTAFGGGRLSALVIVLTNISLGQMMSRIYLRGKKGGATRWRFAAVMLLVIMSVLMLPTFFAGRYVRTLLP